MQLTFNILSKTTLNKTLYTDRLLPPLKSLTNPAVKTNYFEKYTINLKDRIMTGSNQLKLRCTEFDHKGNVKSLAGEFSKLEFCSSIDSKYVNQMPAILVRKEAILINLVLIRALIKADCVILFDSLINNSSSVGTTNTSSTNNNNHSTSSSNSMVLDVSSLNDAGSTQSSFVYDLQERLRMNKQQAHGLPYEFRALESILIGVVSALQIEAEVVVQLVSTLLYQLEENIDRNKLKQLLHSSKRLHKIEQRLMNIRNAITEVLEQGIYYKDNVLNKIDEDLVNMYLTSKKNNIVRDKKDHDEVEMLLENYLKQVEEITNVVTQMSTNVKTTEDIAAIILDSQRNSLQIMELKLTIVMLGFSIVAGIAAIFGMNLSNHMERDKDMFFVVSMFACVLAVSVMGVCNIKMRNLTKYLK